jgi:hypothetical protein
MVAKLSLIASEPLSFAGEEEDKGENWRRVCFFGTLDFTGIVAVQYQRRTEWWARLIWQLLDNVRVTALQPLQVATY